MAYLLVVPAVVASAAPLPAARGRFVPGEIIVKFRAAAADVNDTAVNLRASGKPTGGGHLPAIDGRCRVREMEPLLANFDRHLAKLRTTRVRREARTLRARGLPGRQRHGGEDAAAGPGRIYRLRLDLEANQDIREVLAAWRNRPDVEYAELNPIISICATPDDPSYAEQWSLGKIQAPEAWDTSRGAADVVVAVIDTGVDYNHRDLQGNLWVNEAEVNGVAGVDDDDNGYIDDVHGYNFAYNNSDPIDDHGHGTHCSGIIAAVGDNGLDVAGVCWSARIMALKILGSAGDGSAADAVPAIYYAVANGADVISGSWGGEDSSDVLREAIAYAHREGVVVVAAAGNEGSDAPFYPAAYPEVISVAATDSTDQRWYLSNYGDWVDIAAPGRDIVSLRATGSSQGGTGNVYTGRMSGTSMAAPHVSGACALLLAANPFLTCDEVADMLTAGVDPIASGICASNGRLNLYGALRTAIPAEGTIRLDRAAYREQADLGILLADWDLRGTGQQVVLIEAGSGDQEMVALAETPVALGVFRGKVPTQSGAAEPGDGILQVQHGESIFARYVDGDVSGQAGRWRQAEAIADYQAPSVYNLVIETRGRTATIDVLTSEPTRAVVRYGTTCGGPYERTARGAELADEHAIPLRGLIPHTQYCFVVALVDEAGNEILADNAGGGYTFVADSNFPGFQVPGVYPTIQAAIDDAADGDTIWVADGTYSGEGNIGIDFQGKAITVRSENGPAACVIDCNEQGRAFYFHCGETADSILDGFTIANGGGTGYGGGVRCMGSSPTIRNCIFRRNVAAEYGGGLCNCYGSSPHVINCTFEENSCLTGGWFGRGGGMANRHGSHPVVTDCTFIGNSAGYAAGALGNFDGSSPVVTRCVFRANSVKYSGGAVADWGAGHPVFTGCAFSGNRADDDGGAMSNMPGSEPVLENCIFHDNVADGRGGAMKNQTAVVSLSNCTISGNRAEQSCGGIWSGADSRVRLDNCILWANADGDSGAQAEPAQLVARDSEVMAMHSCVQGWTGGLGGIGNLGRDPLFVDAGGGDFHLKSNGWRWDRLRTRWTYDAATSPCIDAGNPGWPLGDEPLNVPDDPNSTLAVNTRIDMGAYGGTAEASLAPPGWALSADVNNDGAVDWPDLMYIAAHWARTGDRLETDFTRDGATSGADLALLATQWRHRAKPPAIRTAALNR